jgi:hypothetical protein
MVSPDGRRFLMNTVAEEAATPITVILNWTPRPKERRFQRYRDGATSSFASAARRFEHLQVKHETEPGLDVFHELTAKPTRALDQKIAVDRNELRHVGDGVLRKA